MIPHSKPWIGEEEVEAVARVLRSGHLAQGAEVEAFERECADFLGRKHAVAVSSGTAALHLALGALGVSRDEPVAVPSYACAALITAVHMQQASPVLCDVCGDGNLDPATAPQSCRTIIVPHMFGKRAKLPERGAVIEDIAQSFGTATGLSTPVSVTSFYATKLMTTGEGGMLFCDDDAIAEYARDRRDYDNRDDYIPRHPYKMTDFQAAMGRVQLRKLPKSLEHRNRIARRYEEVFARLPLGLPNPENHAFFRYVVRSGHRSELDAFLNARAIEAKRPVYRPAHHYLGGEFPSAQRAHDEFLSLPIFPGMIDGEVERVIDSARLFFA